MTQKRVFFFVHVEIRNFLVAADIQRTDNDLFPLHFFGDLLIGGELFVLRRAGVAVHEQEFGAEQPHALAVVV